MFADMKAYLDDPKVMFVLLAVVPVWLLGAASGHMMSRSRWLHALGSSAILHPWNLQIVALLINGVLIIRECFDRYMEAGAFSALAKAVLLWFCGKGWTFEFPQGKISDAKGKETKAAARSMEDDSWYVNSTDLQFYKDKIEIDQAGGWQLMMEKEVPNLMLYKAWRRTLPNGKTEYKTTSVCPDSTAEEFMDFYLDDDARPVWDTMITKHEILQRGEVASRQMVVRWTRKFPFSFITDREYTIARRMFREPADPASGAPASLYAMTKVVDLPDLPPSASVVNTDVFYSMWRSRDVPCPWGSGKPACETVLLHHEQMKIPENLSRFAAKHGMWGFVRKMADCVGPFVQSRRQRLSPTDDDPTPYGFTEGECASSLTKSKPMSMSSLSLVDRKPLGVIMEDPASDDETNNRLASPEPGNKKAFKRFATLAVASSIAVVMKHSYSTGSLSTMEPGMMKEETPEKSPDSISSSRDSATRRVAPRYRSTSRRLPRIRSAPYPMW